MIAFRRNRHPVTQNPFAIIVGLMLLMAGCSPGKPEGKGPAAAIPVTVGSVIQRDVPVQIRAIGNVQAYSTVSVKAMVGGEVTVVHFKEGQDVRRGDLLFTIDPRPYEATLKQAEANLTRDVAQVAQGEANLAKSLAQVKEAEANLSRSVAQAKNAESDAQRYKSLIERKVISEQQYDQVRTNADALVAAESADKAALENAEAAVQAAKAALEMARAAVLTDRAVLENAKIQLGYCTIRSPIDGRTGNLLVNQGNIVKANETPYLVIINQITPIYVSFAVPEQNLAEIKKYLLEGKLKVEALFSNDGGKPEEGSLSFVDNAVDSATGTIRLKGVFPNQDRRLWPGQFVDVALTLTTDPRAIVVPSQAVQTGQAGQYVFVVRSDGTVESRPVVVRRTLDEEVVIDKGLAPREVVVTDGQLQLVPGARVEIKGSNPPDSQSAFPPEKRS
jgi:multidrug efflux system membrane fusion protein